MPPYAPEWFLKELKTFDSDLRLRWSPRWQLWALERQVRRSLHPGTTKGDSWDDDYIRARDGFILVASIPPRGLSRYVFQRLKDADIWAQGGWSRVADKLDEAEAAEEEAKWNSFADENRAVAKDLYNILAIREGHTMFSPGVVQ